jgi:hypothetical protein
MSMDDHRMSSFIPSTPFATLPAKDGQGDIVMQLRGPVPVDFGKALRHARHRLRDPGALTIGRLDRMLR